MLLGSFYSVQIVSIRASDQQWNPSKMEGLCFTQCVWVAIYIAIYIKFILEIIFQFKNI